MGCMGCMYGIFAPIVRLVSGFGRALGGMLVPRRPGRAIRRGRRWRGRRI